ncbi:arylsulfatase A-like enzyme [Actinoplanes octamycinicus]|uniref:Arylsulfatase A-like enzyme n=1 Tax=Actinoplanes octamycinicus TaxID=135948 RepID=A0A7W7H5T7_9ACTN|nr:sulfatase-like hydrolase/transferase [Actinoplanes octamycinicus]MBB4744372.1 arylsulfatase A-like enzyme [Actinoplanes octamycinicus]GIE56666.1 N-acetylgalactosamine-6-sulfatase [Actinoplanes octamycinicus]
MTNRGTTRRGVFGALAGAAAATTLPAEAEAAERPFQAAPAGHGKPAKRPNILFILADDLGWADLSSYGAVDIKTPHLDRLARAGVRFTQAYSAGAVCSPTRVSLYTGRYPGRIPGGLPEPIGAANATDGIPAGHPTLASLLKKSGYATALIGKWHGGFLPHFGPLKSGWDEFYGNYSGGLDYYSKYSHTGQYDLYEGETPVQDDRYYTDILAERAEAFVRREHTAPWLLNLNFTSPHWPWEAPGDRAVSAEITAKIKAGNLQAIFHNDGGSLDTYRKMVENLDTRIGQVLTALRQTGQEENTLVVFASDNGGERFSYQWPLTGNKAGLNEGGIRVPTIVRWPARIRGHQVSHQPVITPDWTATLLEIAGVAPDPAYPLDGTSLAGYLLRGADAPEHDLFWRTRASRALRRGKWKYLRSTATGADLLYDLEADPREQANLAARQPALVAELRAAWEQLNATQLPYG